MTDSNVPISSSSHPLGNYTVDRQHFYECRDPNMMCYAYYPSFHPPFVEGVMNCVPLSRPIPYYLPQPSFYPAVDFNSLYQHHVNNTLLSMSRMYNSQPSMGQIVPPPPEVPIFNPVVYSNNCDVGMHDLEYISETEFPLLNAHSSYPISIPRPYPPHSIQSPQDLIPPLVPTHAVSTTKPTVKSVEPVPSPSSVFTSSTGVKTNNDKLFVIGFSWDAQPFDGEFVGDVWIKPKH